MKIYALLICIYSCILRKKEHCIANKIIKNRLYPDFITKSSVNSIQNDKLTKKKIDIVSLDHKDEIPKVKRYKIELPKNDTRKESESEEIFFVKSDKNKKSSDVSNKLCTDNNNFTNNSINLEHILSDKHLISNCMENLFRKIKQYMITVFTDVQLKKYLPKLSNVNLIYGFFIDKESHLRSYRSIFRPFDSKLVEILDIVISKFKTETSFVEIICENFLYQLQNSLDSDIELNFFLMQLRGESADTKRFLFYAEILNCAKYFEVVPELMTLAGIFSEKSIGDLIVSIHLINVLLNYKEDINKIKVFILFLMKKAFSSSLKNRLDCFSIRNLYTNCSKNQYDLNFLIWEMNYGKRNHIKKKLKNDNILKYKNYDKTHFRAVILIFIYQQMIFLRFNNVDYKDAEKFFQLIESIITGNNCPDCDFYKFIELLRELNKKKYYD